MTRRRLQGATCASLFGVGAIAATLSACGAPEPDSVIACAGINPPHYRVEDARCDRNEPGVGRFVMQMPETRYEYTTECCDEDGLPYTESWPVFAPIIVSDVGRPLGVSGNGDLRNGFVRAQPGQAAGSIAGVTRAVAVPPRATPGAPLGASTISRGGLGVTGGGKGGAGFTGSSGGS